MANHSVALGGAARRPPKKYCSILTYVEHNNRELFDTIHDLCLSGSFSLRKQPDGLTFLMPATNSELHKSIVNAAYGSDPERAVKLINACVITRHVASIGDFKQGEAYTNKLGQELHVATASLGSVTFDGGAKIVADETFATLYSPPRFSVYSLQAGMISIDGPAASNEMGPATARPKRGPKKAVDETVSGGAWPALRNVRSAYGDRIKLAREAVNTHKNWLISQQRTANLPAWFGGENANNIFARWGVSLAAYLKASGQAALVEHHFHPNPMCVTLFTCLMIDEATYNSWLAHEDEKSLTYDYASYSAHIAKPTAADNKAEDVIKRCIGTVRAQGKMADVVKIILEAYKERYGADYKRKLMYDEGVFLFNNYVRLAARGETGELTHIADVIIRDYCNPLGQSILTSDLLSDMPDSPELYCKLVEFVLSESFMFPSQFSATSAQLPDYSEPKPKLADPPVGLNFSKQLAAFFA